MFFAKVNFFADLLSVRFSYCLNQDFKFNKIRLTYHQKVGQIVPYQKPLFFRRVVRFENQLFSFTVIGFVRYTL